MHIPSTEEVGAGAIERQFSREELETLCRTDLTLLGMICMPETVELDFPPIHLELWKLLTSASDKPIDFSKFAVGLPRGHAKTLVIKLFIIWIILYTKRQFILVVGATADLSENIIADVVDILDSENFTQTFGNWRYNLQTDRQHFKKFAFRGRDIILKSAGAGTAVRGIAVKNRRPDVIICDDSQTKESAESPVESLKYIKWFLGTLMKAKNPRCCTYVYIGNMYPDVEISKATTTRPALYTCLLRNLQLNPAWISFIVGGILTDGQALWPELHSLENLLEELKQDLSMGQEGIFYAEVLNDPAAISSRLLDSTKLAPFVPHPEDAHFGSFILIDPSGFKKKSDDTAIGYCELYEGKPYLRDLRTDRMSPMQTIHAALTLAIDYKCPAIFVESVAYQSTLVFWFEQVMNQRDIRGITVYPIEPGGRSKHSRILAMFRQWENGEIGVFDNFHSVALTQAMRFNPLVTTNKDDILDILAYMTDVVLKHTDALVIDGEYVEVGDVEFASIPHCDDYTDSVLLG